jgi:hypothetical protein
VSRERKFDYLHVLQGHYGYGWEDLTAAETRAEIVGYRRDYRENEPGTALRIIRRREMREVRS